MKQVNLSIEQIENGYIVSGYTYGSGDGSDPIIGPCGTSTKTFAKDWDVARHVANDFLIANS
jgi:hypothetical protein